MPVSGSPYKDQLHLQLGVGLSAEQMAALTHDIVWLEEVEVNGEKVLAPVVYLAQAEGRLAPNGALIQRVYLGSTHWPWIGERTRQVDGAHVALLAEVLNPVACKVGPEIGRDQLLALCERLDPRREPGRLTLIARMGAQKVGERLPPLVEAVASAHDEPRSPEQKRRAMSWAQRLKRVFSIDITTCAHCGGAVRIVASIEEPTAIRAILAHFEKHGALEQAHSTVTARNGSPRRIGTSRMRLR
ncbi:phenazine biosynthesis protein PhzC [Pseudomonas aeruginosa PA38182]|nr:phenazine biosynthesis protein PhzC [Pseudomonas aeruginosa PA38182]